MDGEAILRAAFVLKRDLGEPALCTISGNCMAPFLNDGDELAVEHDIDELRVGQVVLFLDAGRLFVHRIVAILRVDGGRRYVLAADGTCVFRRPMTRDRIVGRVIRVRGVDRRYDLDRPSWRAAGRALAWRLRLVRRARLRHGAVGRVLASAVAARRRLLPARWSLTTAPFELLVAVHGVWNRRTTRQRGR